MAQPASPHLRHQESGVLATATRRQRNSDFIVERPHRSHHRTKNLKYLGQHVLGACLTAGTSQGDSTHAALSFRRHDVTCQSREAGLAVVNNEVGQLRLSVASGQDGGSASVLSSLGEVMAVYPSARKSNKQSTRSHFPGINDDIRAHLSRIIDRCCLDPLREGGNVENSHRA